MLGGPFEPQIERILRDNAYSSSSPVILSSDPGIRSTIRGLKLNNGRPCQSCDMLIRVEKDIQLVCISITNPSKITFMNPMLCAFEGVRILS